jgi:hypothetical protein
MHPSNVKVLYIDGQGRSGSTLLHNVLGQVEGFFAAGELREIWKRISANDRTCGCGNLVNECDVWKGVLNEAFGGLCRVEAAKMERSRNRARNRHSPLLVLPRREPILASRLQDYLVGLEKLYQGIRAYTGSKVIIDSSKSLLYGYLLGMLPTIDLYVLHIVRDPRGVAYSLQQRKLKGLPQFSGWNPVTSSLVWDTVNLSREMFWGRSGHPYLRLCYEEFVRRPRESVERILDLVEEEVGDLPFVSKQSIVMNTTHSVGGNANTRFLTGRVDLRLDERWRDDLSFTNKAIITSLTWPLILRYGYHKQ